MATYLKIEVQEETYQAGQFQATPEGNIVRANGQIHNRMAIRLEPKQYWWRAVTLPMASPLPGNKGHELAKAMWSDVTEGQIRAMWQVMDLVVPYNL